jgi:hypothetical protein
MICLLPQRHGGALLNVFKKSPVIISNTLSSNPNIGVQL